jgi:hypothetical protein
MDQLATLNDDARHLVRFDPKRYRLHQAAFDYGINEAKRIKDWPMLERAADQKIADQQQFVAWWYAHVSVNHGVNRQQVSTKAILDLS